MWLKYVLAESAHTNRSLHCTIITLDFLLVSSYRVKDLKECRHYKSFPGLLVYPESLTQQIKKSTTSGTTHPHTYMPWESLTLPLETICLTYSIQLQYLEQCSRSRELSPIYFIIFVFLQKKYFFSLSQQNLGFFCFKLYESLVY